MSDRPVRLKYLTKMKIILCIFLLYITAVSVFGQSQELNGVLGESVKFPAAVKIDGSLRNRSVTIGDMTSGRFTTPDKYKDRVQWDSSTGFFSLSGLRLEDSGVYTVQDTQQNIITVFQLNVYEGNVPVSKPHVSITHNEYPCTIECTAERGTGVTLSWYREGEKKPYVSSRVASAPHLHLPVPVESGTYTCEVKNSVSNEKASITVGADCRAGLSAGTIAAIIIAAVLIVALIAVFVFLYRRIRKEQADEEALILDAFRRVIRDEANQGLIKDVIRSKLEDKCNRGLLLVDEANQGLIKDVIRSKLEDKCNRGLLLVVFGKVIQDEAYQVLIKDAVRRLILVKDILNNVDPRALHEANQGLIKDVKDILDKVDPRALRSVMSDRSDELEDETP